MTDIKRCADSYGSDVFTSEMLTLMRMYETSEAPVAVLDRFLNVLWANGPAIKLSSGLSMADGVVQLLTSYTTDKVIGQTDGLTPLTLVSNTAMLTIHLTPVGGGYLANFAPYVDTGTGLHPQGQQLLISAVSGQLRRPLNNMFASIASLRQLNIADEYPELNAFVESINENAYKLLRTTTNITHYFKYFSPETEEILAKVNLGDCLGNLLRAAAIMTGGVGIPLTYNLPTEPIYTAINEQLLITAILQVISNSCRFTKEGNAIHVTLTKRTKSATITIADQGLGIPASMADKVFEPFFSFDHNGLPFAGVGLGLTIARSALMQMGGRIAVTSTENEGTLVAITLPLADTKEMGLRAPYPSVDYLRDRFSPLHVLLSDACGCPAP